MVDIRRTSVIAAVLGACFVATATSAIPPSSAGSRGSPCGRWRSSAGKSARYELPTSLSILNIGRYIEMTITPTMQPTPIIISGSMIEVSDETAASTSSS